MILSRKQFEEAWKFDGGPTVVLANHDEALRALVGELVEELADTLYGSDWGATGQQEKLIARAKEALK